MLTPIKAIRKKCLECSNYQYKEVELCPIKDCPLYPYRFGKRPSTIKGNAKKRELSNDFLSEGVNDE
jgi:hypothetical protein